MGTNSWDLLRRTHTDYELSAAYVNQRLTGLSKQQFLFGPEDNGQRLYSKMSYEYDAGGEFLQNQGNPVQHDANYGTAATVRGNVTRALRWDVNYESDTTHATASTVGYNTCGSTVLSRDPLGNSARQTTISYTDSFSTNGIDSTTLTFATMAYPTTITDPDGFSATAKYNYDLGALTRTQDPKGAAQTTEYDAAGRVKRVTNAVNSAYTRFVYPASQTIIVSATTINDLNPAHEAFSFSVFDGDGRVRAKAADFPDTTPHYSGSYTAYDVMGRAVSQSNPVEITGSWTAMGADAAAQGGFGWVFTMQTYDWKGRPLVTTNTDGTTKEASYGGCGCAGGEVVTLTDEGTIAGGLAKRRQQKLYSDALGRSWKTETLNWQGGSVYSTTVNTLNARDQVTLARQYQGTEASSALQETPMAYDGYGRLKTKHIPQQDSGTATTWAYNDDDTLKTMTDARGSVSHFSYNARHLLEGITYDPSAGITDTPDVSFGYDAAGNRTSMTDGLGSVSYVYNTLSRLESETRTFTGVGVFPLSYQYNLAGELIKLTDSTNMSINYALDTTGRLTQVTGSDNLYAGISNYASNFQYRAWGGLKSMTDGKGYTSSLVYNAKLQPTHFEISGSVVSQNYDYYDDGRMSFVHSATDNAFDRSYSYDHASRLTLVKSGGQARGDSGTSPFYEAFSYDPFSNLTGRTAQSWNGFTDDSDYASYTNNRRTGWGYDADGRNTTIDTRSNTFDAAGQQTLMTAQQVLPNGNHSPVNATSGYNGDGARIKDVALTTTYYLRSSLLGGAIIEELNSSGQKNAGYVCLPGGQLLATQTPNYPSNMVTWKHNTPAGTSEHTINTYNTVISRTEFDPLGANLSLTQPEAPPPPEGEGDIGAGHFGGLLDARWSDFFNLESGFYVDGHSEPASIAMFYVNFGTGRSLRATAGMTGAALASSMPLVFASADTSVVHIGGPGVEGTPGHQTLENRWIIGIKDTNGVTLPDAYGPVPTAYSGINSIPGSIVTLASNIQPRPQDISLPVMNSSQALRLAHSFADARNTLTTKGTNAKTKAAVKKCLDFFTQGRSLDEVLDILTNFNATATYAPSIGKAMASTANSGGGMTATLKLGDAFFADDNSVPGTGLSWSHANNMYLNDATQLTPRQNRTLTILHELGHALGLLPSDNSKVDPKGEISAQNDAMIYEKCGAMLDSLPLKDF